MTTLADLSAAYEAERTTFLARVGQATALQEQLEGLTTKVEAAASSRLTHEQVAALFQAYSESEHEQLRQRIEGLVTLGIETVFGPGIRFKLTPDTKAGQAIIGMTVVSEIDGEEVETEIVEARGGGLAAVIGFVLRVVILSLSPDQRRPTLFLDETFGMLSAQYQEGLSRLLKRLTEEIGLQVILVSHQEDVATHADVVYQLGHDGSRTEITSKSTGQPA